MSVEGHYDQSTGLVSLVMHDGDAGDLDEAIRWLRQLRGYQRRQEIKANGGYRWTFVQGVPPRARYDVGKQKGILFPLREVRRKQSHRCRSCEVEIPAGVVAWKQAPGCHAGYSAATFCVTCIEQGAARAPVNLVLIQGGKETGNGQS